MNRDVALKRECSGVLLNPNCRYEANFMPFYTLSVWAASETDETDEMDSSPNAQRDDDSTAASNAKVAKFSLSATTTRRVYKPAEAINEAIDAWLELFKQGPGPAPPP